MFDNHNGGNNCSQYNDCIARRNNEYHLQRMVAMFNYYSLGRNIHCGILCFWENGGCNLS